jgi:hypothetical protein
MYRQDFWNEKEQRDGQEQPLRTNIYQIGTLNQGLSALHSFSSPSEQ